MTQISVCIPAYEMNGKGAEYLRHSLDMLAAQTFKDFEVVVSDHSVDDNVEKACRDYGSKLDIRYSRNSRMRGSSSANVNDAMSLARGKTIKILFQDDFLYHKDSLMDIAAAFDPDRDSWLATACIHTKDGRTFYREFHPRYSESMPLGRNTMSSPSVIAVRNTGHLRFDEKLTWLMDMDYYRRMHDAFGSPKILDSVNVVNRAGEHQVTHTIATQDLKDREYAYVLKKHFGPFGSRARWIAYKATSVLRRILRP